ncbi:RxLR-like protein [Plasmopara halstedii]|uniref:RxLR-like protein n=1 Tax=Plasmopara halstedii TaxID=4781 RepID=A0A0P1ANA9_PLAHL|nr:RxLR-like protein [Plasmopara halstedii]CEG42729.1 RxLR-like protein [Plasmopara halstedii]|eukprot:XP_024579098.1 RxLR-like protein [Plasmopara halstedii]
MKFYAFIASLLAAASGIAADASVHLRVNIMMKRAALNEQCEWINKAVRCDTGMFCQRKARNMGLCLKTEPGLNDQCGGNGASGSWSRTCSGSDTTCWQLSTAYSRCRNKSDVEKIKMNQAVDKRESAELYGRCRFEDGTKSCASGLQCVGDNNWSGTCMKKQANLFDQCAGQDIGSRWEASCPKDTICYQYDKNYSQCLPEAPK